MGFAAAGLPVSRRPIGPPARVQLRPEPAQGRPHPVAPRPHPHPPSLARWVHGTEPVQGGATREDAGVCDLRRRGPGAAGPAASAVRGPGLAVRGPSVRRVPLPSGGEGSRRVVVPRVVVLGVPHGLALARPRPASGAVGGVVSGPRTPWVLLVGLAALRGRGGLRVRRAAGAGHLPPARPRVVRGRGPASLGAHHAPLVPRGALARVLIGPGVAGGPPSHRPATTHPGPVRARGGSGQVTGGGSPGRGWAR